MAGAVVTGLQPCASDAMATSRPEQQALLGMAPAYSGSHTAGSITSQTDAIANASATMPAGSPITAVKCTTKIRDISARYRCTVQ